MPPFDPDKPARWVKRLFERAAKTRGSFSRSEPTPPGDRQHNAIALGLGTFAAPLPHGWSLHPVRPFEGRIRVKEGFDIQYRIDSYEDPEAAKGGSRLLDYVDEPELTHDARTPADVQNKVLIAIPAEDTPGRSILWKYIDTRFGTHVRELQLRCLLDSDERVANRGSIGEAVGEWLQLGGFSPERTALDQVAHTAVLERANFEDAILMRVPRAWKIEVDSKNDDGRSLFAVDEPEDRETLWVTSMVYKVSGRPSAAKMDQFQRELFDTYWKESEKRWHTRRRRQLRNGDLLIFLEKDEIERSEKLRRRHWIRLAIRDDHVIVAPIHLVTAARYLGDPAQIETEVLFQREVENALLSRPARDQG